MKFANAQDQELYYFIVNQQNQRVGVKYKDKSENNSKYVSGFLAVRKLGDESFIFISCPSEGEDPEANIKIVDLETSNLSNLKRTNKNCSSEEADWNKVQPALRAERIKPEAGYESQKFGDFLDFGGLSGSSK